MVDKVRSYIYVIISAALYAAAFFCPGVYGVGIFFFLIPLCWVTFKPFWKRYACIWALIAFSPHVLCLSSTLRSLGTTPLKYVLQLTVIVWFVVTVLFWFFCLAYAQRVRSSFLFFYSTFVYWFFVHHRGLFFIAYGYGYPLAFPLIPLTIQVPCLLHIAWYTGRFFLLAVLIVSSVWLGMRGTKRDFFLHVVLGGVGVCIFSQIPALSSKKSLAPIQPITLGDNFLKSHKRLQLIKEALQKYKHNKHIKLYVFPESFLTYLTIFEQQEFFELCRQDYMKAPCLVGGIQKNGSAGWLNTLFLVHKGFHDAVYFKSKLLPFVETPAWIEQKGSDCNRHCFLPTWSYCAPLSSQESIYIPHMGYVCPLICSEAVWHFPWQAYPVVACMHDGHFKQDYYRRLLYTCVALEAAVHRTPLVYAGYFYAGS